MPSPRRRRLLPALLLSLLPPAALSSGYYCGSSYQDAVDSCSIACPSALGYNAQSETNECPEDKPYCFGPGLPCVPTNETVGVNATDGGNSTDSAMDGGNSTADGGNLTDTTTSDDGNSTASSPEPFTAQSEINLNFCGLTLDDANDCTNATWCPSGSNSDCPPGLNCFTNTMCNATELDLVDLDLLANLTANSTNATDDATDAAYMNGTYVPSPTPGNQTYGPTIDLNPDDYYCSATWQAADYDGECGAPCPTRSNDECPEGTYCYGPMPNCKPTYKVGVSTRWCGATFNDMASKCATECRNGTDEECPEGEICWGGSPCAMIDYQKLDLNASKGKLWCGKSYKDLVENCPKECPGATDEECGDGMICFNMSEEEQSCNETGVGIKEPVDSANLWCGSSWNDVLENCAKNCPEGSDEECGPGLICYDLTGNDLICETAGVGVKEKGDPQTRWCGADFNDMLATCPKRCPETTECDEGQICFEGSPCVTEGVGVGGEEQDPDKMFCGSDYTAAMSCGTACPNGDADCPSGESCFSDVECLWSAPKEEAMTDSTPSASTEGPASTEGTEAALSSSSVSAMLMDVTVSEEDAEPNADALTDSTPSASTEGTVTTTSAGTEASSQSEAMTDSAESEPSSSEEAPAASEEAPAESSTEEAPAAESSTEEAPAESSTEEAPAESSTEEAPAAESSTEEAPAAESSTEEAPAEESDSLINPFEETPSDSDTSSGVVAENLRMALYGLPEMTSDMIVAWETSTASYFEEFYNDYTDSSDATRAAVNDVETMYDFTEMNIASSRRVLHIRRRLADTAHLITYTQTTKYMTDDDVKLGDVLQYPFNDPEKRALYIQYLKDAEPDLFSSLEDVSTVFLPQGLESSPPSSTAAPEQASDGSAPSTEDEPVSNSMVNPFEEESSSEESPAPADSKFQSFYCQNSGLACPTGECEGDDACVFVPDGSAAVQVGSYTPESQTLTSNPEDAAHMVSSVLSGAYKPTSPSATMSTAGSGSSAASSSDPLPYSDAEYGPKSVNGVMTLTGLNMIKVDNIFEWQYLTAVYEQNFYNNDGPIGDAVKDAVYNFATVLEAVDLSYGQDGSTPTTTINFKQTFKYDTTDPDLSSATIASRPFLNDEDRDNYIAYLKEMLPESFGSLTDSSSSAPQSNGGSGSAINTTELLQKLTDTFYCAEAWPVDCQSAESCKTGDNCPDGQTCFTAPMCPMQQNSSPLAPSASDTESSDSFSDHDASNGPSHVNGEMTLTGMNMIKVDNIFEWQDLTALFEEQFYNVDDGSQDYVKNSVHNFATVLEALDLSYGDDDGTPTTVIKFKQSIKYDSKDPDIPVTAIVTQPFLTPEYRTKYIDYLKEMLPDSFGDLTMSSSVPDSEGTSEDADEAMAFLVKLRETFFCSVSYPVNCQTAQRCESGDNCPDGQTCFTAPTCAAQSQDDSSATTPFPETSTTPVPQTSSASLTSTESGMGEFSASLTDSSSSSTTAASTTNSSSTIVSTTTSMLSTSAPTPAPLEDEFFCGTSWLDASDRCYKPCPSGDASDCEEGEGCFAFTSCEKTESFYCGYNFEQASSSCEYPCSGMNVFDCPQGMGCFQYTTCQGVNTPSNETNSTESETDLPRDAFCGTSLEDAEASCAGGRAISCQVGNDGQCPGGMECFATTTCTSRDSFYCGASWKEAAETCGKPCSSGSSDECDEGQFCFAYTGCESNLFFCGESYDSASESCTSPEGPTPCSNQSPDQCPENQYCFAFVTACASSADSMSLGAFGDFEGAITGSDASSQERPDWLANYWETKPESSSSMKRISLYLMSLSSVFVMLNTSL